MNATEVILALRRHYGDAWALVEQVANGTGWSAGRWLDVIAFGLWPSRGLEVHGIEVKVSRGDWRRELRQPAKADAVASRCDRFWIAASAGIVDPLQLATLAPNWGLLEVDGAGRVQTKRQAERLDAVPLDRTFVAAVMRQLPKPTDALRAEIDAVVRAEYEADVERAAEVRSTRTSGRYEEIVERVEQFIALTGIDLLAQGFESPFGAASPEDIAVAVGFLLGERRDKWDSVGRRIEAAAQSVEHQSGQLAESAARLRAGAAALAALRGRPAS
jgi:hypothetical protein